MSMRASGSEVTSPALGNQGMDMRIPFQIPPEGMQDADKARSKVFGLVKLEEHTQDDIPDRMKQAVKKGMVLKKKDAEFFRNDKDTMPVNAGNQFTGHMKSPFLIIHVATGRTETAFTGKRDKFKVPTMRAAKESAASAMGRYYLHTADEDREVTPAELKQFFVANEYKEKWEKTRSETLSKQADKKEVKTFYEKTVSAGRMMEGRK